jgi:hypothetical protein
VHPTRTSGCRLISRGAADIESGEVSPAGASDAAESSPDEDFSVRQPCHRADTNILRWVKGGIKGTVGVQPGEGSMVSRMATKRCPISGIG